MASKKPVRDCNKPVLSFKIGSTQYDILIAGPGEFITQQFNGGKHNWSDNSLIVREHSQMFRETEYNLHDASVWGWLGRLMVDGTIDRKDIKLLTATDSPHFNEEHGLPKESK